MKQFILFLLLYLLSLATSLPAQNLVPNGDFETCLRRPTNNNNGVDCTKHWRCPNFSASDYYHVKGEKKVRTPRNRFGKQKPHSGKAYAGICILGKYKEYIAVKLTDTLKNGQDYKVEFYISRANKSLTSVHEFGVMFTNRINYYNQPKGLREKPSVDFVRSFGFRNKRKWIKLSGIYRAEGSENVIIIGYFNYKRARNHQWFCHYYIDDVSVTLISEAKDSVIDAPEVTAEVKEEPTIVEEYSPEAGESITLHNVFFETNKSELLPASFPELDKLVRYLNKVTNTSITISGHTDSSGNENQNKLLSESRAKAVSDYLIAKRINSSRISYQGYGSSQPIADNITEQGKKENRRVEFVIYQK